MWLNIDVLLERWLGRWRLRPKLTLAIVAIAVSVAGTTRSGLRCARGGDVALAGVRVLDVETGHRFRIELTREFAGWPVRSPDTGRHTGYPAEVCRSPKCRERGGTWVVLNAVRGRAGPTRCPSCRERVRSRHAEDDEPPEVRG